MTVKEYETIFGEAAASIVRLAAALKESLEENRRIVKVCNDIYDVTAKPDESNWKADMEYINDLVSPYQPF